MRDRMERLMDRAIWMIVGMAAAVLLLLIAVEASGDDESILVDPPVHAGLPVATVSVADLVIELVRRIDAAGGGHADAAEEIEGLRVRIALGDDAAYEWASRFAASEAALRAARRGDLDGDGDADGDDLGIVLLAVAGELPPEPEQTWWMPGGDAGGSGGGD